MVLEVGELNQETTPKYLRLLNILRENEMREHQEHFRDLNGKNDTLKIGIKTRKLLLSEKKMMKRKFKKITVEKIAVAGISSVTG